MANVKISDLPAIATLTTEAIIPATQDGVTGRTTVADILGPSSRMVISGLIQSQATDADHDTTISAGGAMDATDTYRMTLSAITKQIDAAWAVGSDAGGLDTGAVGNSSWYYIWLIARSDTGVVDALYSLSSTAPTMPANYDFKRLIGAVRTDGSANIVDYTAYELSGGGLELLWTVPTLDVDLADTLTTSRRTDAVKVPLNFSVLAHLNVLVVDVTANAAVWVCCPDQADAVPSVSAAPLANAIVPASNISNSVQMHIRTSAAGLIAARSNIATIDLYAVSTMGFEWARRN